MKTSRLLPSPLFIVGNQVSSSGMIHCLAVDRSVLCLFYVISRWISKQWHLHAIDKSHQHSIKNSNGHLEPFSTITPPTT
ncbi:hypothetical protein CEXT_202371 [Caerostris extrusa]|uniref:Uncharacterized protein n=1 Tax=Caerostris extrusa TaxID=172846 RepID=A0AAV4R927_CAEEX|nr:hypothetical protein CEXT_202371 [Caerostris extrusa]